MKPRRVIAIVFFPLTLAFMLLGITVFGIFYLVGSWSYNTWNMDKWPDGEALKASRIWGWL